MGDAEGTQDGAEELEDEGTGEGGEEGDGKSGSEGDGKKRPESEKFVPLDKHKKTVSKLRETEAKLKAYESGEQPAGAAKGKGQAQEPSEVDQLKADIAELKKEREDEKISKRKDAAFEKAKGKLGADYHLGSEEDQARIKRSVQNLAFNEKTIDSAVEDLVLGARKPVAAAGRKVVGNQSRDGGSGAGNSKAKDPASYTGTELAELRKDNLPEYERVIAERRSGRGAFGIKKPVASK